MTEEIEVISILPGMLLQVQKVCNKPMIMDKHVLKVSQFDHFLLQRALRLHKKDKDRKAVTILFKEHRDRALARLESFKSKVKEEDKLTHGGNFYKCIFGENNLCVQDGIYFDLMHSFEDPTVSRGQLFDLGLIELFSKDKPELNNGKSMEFLIQIKKKKEKMKLKTSMRCAKMNNCLLSYRNSIIS